MCLFVFICALVSCLFLFRVYISLFSMCRLLLIYIKDSEYNINPFCPNIHLFCIARFRVCGLFLMFVTHPKYKKKTQERTCLHSARKIFAQEEVGSGQPPFRGGGGSPDRSSSLLTHQSCFGGGYLIPWGGGALQITLTPALSKIL